MAPVASFRRVDSAQIMSCLPSEVRLWSHAPSFHGSGHFPEDPFDKSDWTPPAPATRPAAPAGDRADAHHPRLADVRAGADDDGLTARDLRARHELPQEGEEHGEALARNVQTLPELTIGRRTPAGLRPLLPVLPPQVVPERPELAPGP